MIKKSISVLVCLILAVTGVCSVSAATQSYSPVSISENEITIEAGSKTTVTANINDNALSHEDIEWASSNVSVATVNSNGTVRAVSEGVAEIICTVPSFSTGKTYGDVCTVTVSTPAVSASLNKTEASLPVGGNETFKVTVKGNGSTKVKNAWKTSNTAVAKIDENGRLTALKRGTVTVTCNVQNASTGASLAVRTATVKVFDPETSVVLNTHSLKWAIGRKGTYKPVVTSNDPAAKKITFKASNTKVATVDNNGKLTTKAPGTATITCSVINAQTKKVLATDTCKVTVYRPVTKVTLNTNSINWPIGRSGSFKATVSPSNATTKSVKWSSGNTAVAKVDKNGKLTAVGKGSTTITCTATDGSGKKATCKVTVYQPVTKIKLNKTSLNWKTSQQGTFKATVSPSNAKYKALKWTSSDTSVAKVDKNGKLTAVGKGTAIITCAATDKSGAKATCKVTVKNSYTDDDLFCMAAVMWQEAGALYCSDELQLMVGSVVMNHVAHKSFPDTVRGVITRPGAYGTMGWTGVHLPTSSDPYTKQAVERCYKNAKKVLNGEYKVPKNVIYQAGFVQGSGIYKYTEGMYFCYE